MGGVDDLHQRPCQPVTLVSASLRVSISAAVYYLCAALDRASWTTNAMTDVSNCTIQTSLPTSFIKEILLWKMSAKLNRTFNDTVDLCSLLQASAPHKIATVCRLTANLWPHGSLEEMIIVTTSGCRVCAKTSWCYCWSPQHALAGIYVSIHHKENEAQAIKQLVHDHNLESVRRQVCVLPQPPGAEQGMVFAGLFTNLTHSAWGPAWILLASAAGKRESTVLDPTSCLYSEAICPLSPSVLWVSLTQEKLDFPWKQAEPLFLNTVENHSWKRIN